MAHQWSSTGVAPIAPKNAVVVSPYVIGVLDLRWDDPTLLARNSAHTIVGVNIYRSDASDRGPYRRINEYPIGGTFYRDRTDYARVEKEPVQWGSSWRFKGDAPNDRRWVFRSQQKMVKQYDTAAYQTPTYADSPTDVTLYINGVVVPVAEVFGQGGEVVLVNADGYDVVTEQVVPAILPTAEDIVEISYFTPKNHVRSGLDTNVWYRVATVALDSETPSGYIETPLEWCEPHSVIEVETLDYIWREAMRRNAWILQQGGERVSFFIRKTTGLTCECCLDEKTRAYSKQPSNRCVVCYGTGWIGGYEGPYCGIIVPDDAERRITQAMSGRHKEHTYEVWMGPSPLLTQRDFLVKQTNERYSVGATRRPSHRGNVLQQHFNIRYLDQGDIRYSVPIDGTTYLTWPETRGCPCVPPFKPQPVDREMSGDAPWPDQTGNPNPMGTEKSGVCDEIERRGRTRVWENTVYGILWLLILPTLGALTLGSVFPGVMCGL